MESGNSGSGSQYFRGARRMVLVDREEGVTLKDGRRCLRFSLCMYVFTLKYEYMYRTL